MKKSLAIVVPTIREDSIKRFLKEWADEIKAQKAVVYIIEDMPEKTFALGNQPFQYKHYSWEEIDSTLGSSSWIIPRKTDCIRSFGYWKAYKDGATHIITLDDDCYPLQAESSVKAFYEVKNMQPQGVLSEHMRTLTQPVNNSLWYSTIEGLRPRGLPYEHNSKLETTVISHGLWLNSPDVDALTQITTTGREYSLKHQVIPYGQYYPMCGMNLAFTREVTPAMYFLLMGAGYDYDRFGDIWAGLFTKKISDHLGKRVFSGPPAVWHERASDPWVNIYKESKAYKVNEDLWGVVDEYILTKTNYKDCYSELMQYVSYVMGTEYWKFLNKAAQLWLELF